MPPTPTAQPCTPFDILREASLLESLRAPPLESLWRMAPFAIAIAAVVLLAAAAALWARPKRVESWVVLLASIAALIAGDLVWFSASDTATAIDLLGFARTSSVAAAASRAVAGGLAGLSLAVLALAQVRVARLRVRDQAAGRSRRRAALVALGLIGALALVLLALDVAARRARDAREEARTARILARSRALTRKASFEQELSREGYAFALGMQLLESNAGHDALASLDRALAGKPDDAEFLRGRARARAMVGDTVGAAADLRRVLEVDPEYDEARRELEVIEPWRPRR